MIESPDRQKVLAAVEKLYPGWTGFDDPRFRKDELDYKRKAVAKAKDLLDPARLRSLLAEGRHDEFVKAFEQAARGNNLLFQSKPEYGDLNVLYAKRPDDAAFCRALLDLVWGEGPSPARLGAFVAYLAAAGLPVKWTFATYFLFVCHPEDDVFVKPEATRGFLAFLGQPDLEGRPSAEAYARIRQVFVDLREAFADMHPRDMVDAQSLGWVCWRATRAAPASGVRDVAEGPAPDAAPPMEQPAPGAGLTPATFDLLGLLAREPKSQTYLGRKAEFVAAVEEPFRVLFRGAVDRLEASVRDRFRLELDGLLETRNGLFSRILKNDFGQGGAWPFIWAAVYPKGGRRTANAQLYLSMNGRGLHWGFSIGDDGAAVRDRFEANLAENRADVTKLLASRLGAGAFIFGALEKEDRISTRPEDGPDLEGWLADPSDGYQVWRALPMAAALEKGGQELAEAIASDFELLLPLLLLAGHPDPMPLVRRLSGDDVITRPHPLSEVAKATALDLATLERWVRAIHRKGQAVLYGPPGTGKTFVARELARHLIGGGDGFSDLVQFHPAYAYEDFIQGLRPRGGGDGQLRFDLVPGRFLEFCERASKRTGTCVLILDELNRAELSRVFGELMYLLEYRDEARPLAGGGTLRVPANVRLIGTMNTADRSIALVDHALRRRFAFLALEPQYDVLASFHREKSFRPDGLIRTLKDLNQKIADPHYEVGISFFLRDGLQDEIADVWTMEIEPYLEEYFFDRKDVVRQFRWERVRAAVGGNGAPDEPEDGA